MKNGNGLKKILSVVGTLLVITGIIIGAFRWQMNIVLANDEKREKGDKELKQDIILQYDKLDKKLEDGQKEQRVYNQKILEVVTRLAVKLEDN